MVEPSHRDDSCGLAAVPDLTLPAFQRSDLLLGLYLVGVLNGLAIAMAESIRSASFWPAAGSTFGISVVSVAAVVGGLSLIRRSPPRPLERSDALLAAFFVILVMLPHRATTWVAITVLALFELCRAHPTVCGRASAVIFLALAANEFWVSIVIQTLGSTLLSWDATLVAALLGLFVTGEIARTDNLISLPDGSSLALVIGCDSLTNAMYGLLFWLVIAKGFCPAWTRLDLVFAVGVVGSVVILNTVRVALMAIDSESHTLVHGAIGAGSFNFILLIVSAAIALWTARSAPLRVGGRAALPDR